MGDRNSGNFCCREPGLWTQERYISLRHVTSAELTVQTKLRNTPFIRVVLSGVDSHSDQFKMTPVCMKHEN